MSKSIKEDKEVYSPEWPLFLISQSITEFTADLRRISVRPNGFIYVIMRKKEGDQFSNFNEIYPKSAETKIFNKS